MKTTSTQPSVLLVMIMATFVSFGGYSCKSIKASFTIRKGFYEKETFYVLDSPEVHFTHHMNFYFADSPAADRLWVQQINKEFVSQCSLNHMKLVTKPTDKTYIIKPIYYFEDQMGTKKLSDTINGKYKEETIAISQLICKVTYEIVASGDYQASGQINPIYDEEVKVRKHEAGLLSYLLTNKTKWETSLTSDFAYQRLGFNRSTIAKGISLSLWNDVNSKMVGIYKTKL